MKILTSTLGMDAIVTHTDVQMSQGKLAASVTPRLADQFQLKIPGITSSLNRMALSLEASSCHAASSVLSDGLTLVHEQKEKQNVGRVVSKTINQQVQMREFSFLDPGGLSFFTDLESKPLALDEEGLQRATRMSLSLKEIHYQEETLCVSTTGSIETVDGRTINLGLDLAIQRVDYTEQEGVAGLMTARFIDPLVLSFDEGLSVLGNSQFSFDLDSDGSPERIASLKAGSGFLVLDHNGDGLVNNGHELFGPRSGYGYNELRLYDTDNNNWIDENDTVFDRLQLWMGGGSEGGRLIGLREAGVGALSLASVGADFQLKGSDGRILGQISQAGLFLTEAGEVRALTEIDLAVDQEAPVPKWPGFSGEMQEVLMRLREMLIERQRRVAQIGLLARAERWEERRGKLLEQLFALERKDPSQFG